MGQINSVIETFVLDSSHDQPFDSQLRIVLHHGQDSVQNPFQRILYPVVEHVHHRCLRLLRGESEARDCPVIQMSVDEINPVSL